MRIRPPDQYTQRGPDDYAEGAGQCHADERAHADPSEHACEPIWLLVVAHGVTRRIGMSRPRSDA